MKSLTTRKPLENQGIVAISVPNELAILVQNVSVKCFHTAGVYNENIYHLIHHIYNKGENVY